ncbi:CrcB family protein [Actinomycetota bacterium]|nr:CrcB family protein [Actinomycetota bacterium]
MSTILAISVGAFIGAPLRALVEQYATRVRSPLTTLLLINSLGSLLAGFSIGAFSGDLRILLVIGLAGAFTTFSGWALAFSIYADALTHAKLTYSARFVRLGVAVLFAIVIPSVAALGGWLVSQHN